MKQFGAILFTASWMASGVVAQSPELKYAFPSAAAPGKTTEVTFHGPDLAGATALWTSFPAKAVFPTANKTNRNDTQQISCRLTLSSRVPVGIGGVRLATTNGISSLRLFMVDDLPGVNANGQNKTPATAQELRLPVAVEGSCEAMSFNYFKFAAKKSQRISVEVVAQRLGFALDPVLRLLDAQGRELAYSDDAPGLGADSRFVCRIPTDGQYLLEIRDTRYQGGASYRYRLRVGDFPLATIAFPLGAQQGTKAKFTVIGPGLEKAGPMSVTIPKDAKQFSLGVKTPGGKSSGFVNVFTGSLPELLEIEPNDTTASATQIILPVTLNGRFEKPGDRDCFEFEAKKGERLLVSGRTRSLGSSATLRLRLETADGARVAEANQSDASEGSLTNTFKADGTYRLVLEELNRFGGPEFAYRVTLELGRSGFALSADSESVTAPQGGNFELKVTATRRDYTGPITLSVSGLGDGFALEQNVIAEKKNDTVIKARVLAGLKAGQPLTFSIVGQATIDGREFTATASTMAALRKLFPQLPNPPLQLDGLIGLGIKPAEEKPAQANEPAK